MRKFLFLILFVLLSGVVFSQQQEEFSVGVWVFVEDGDYRDRVYNEFKKQVESSNEWEFRVERENPWEANIHIILAGMPTDSNSAYAWSITYTPIFAPKYTNGNVGIFDNSISGMNLVARQTANFVENQLYIWYDDQLEQNP